jgi:hypothetical protein
MYHGLLNVHSGKLIQRHNGKNVKNKALSGVGTPIKDVV